MAKNGKALYLALYDLLQNITFSLETQYKNTDFFLFFIHFWSMLYWIMGRRQPCIMKQSIMIRVWC